MQFNTKRGLVDIPNEDVLAAAQVLREESAMTPEYHAERDACRRIYELWRDENCGRAANELASHVRRVAHISADAEHAVILLEKQASDIRSIREMWKADQDRLTAAEDALKAIAKVSGKDHANDYFEAFAMRGDIARAALAKTQGEAPKPTAEEADKTWRDAGPACRETALQLRIKELEAELEIARAAVPTN